MTRLPIPQTIERYLITYYKTDYQYNGDIYIYANCNGELFDLLFRNDGFAFARCCFNIIGKNNDIRVYKMFGVEITEL